MTIQEKLFPINCHYNFKEESDGKCYSKTCMLNIDPDISMRIEKEGCQIFKHLVKRNGTYELI